MTINAVMVREMRTRMRGWRTAATITLYLAVLAMIAGGTLISNTSSVYSLTSSAQTGATLFGVLSGFQFLLLVFITPASAAPAISGERQRQTLDLLLVTKLSSMSIVLGKLTAALSFDYLLLLCSIPLFSVVFLFGGVDPIQMVEIYLVFATTILILGSMALCVSTLYRRPQSSFVVSNILAFVLTLGLAVLTLFLQSIDQNLINSNGGQYHQAGAPLTAYFDPIFAVFSAMSSGPFNTPPYNGTTPGPFGWPIALWQWNILSNVGLSIVFILLAILNIRSHRRRG